MENIYKIKIRSNSDPRDRYPSERRYSSSIVLGFSVMFLALAMTSSLLGTLVVRRMASSSNHTQENAENSTIWYPSTDDQSNSTDSELEESRFIKKIERDLVDFRTIHHSFNTPAIVSAGSFVMSIGLILAGIAGIFAWKQWYIDNNITWFFLSSCFSTVTSAISLLLITLTLLDSNELFASGKPLPISLGLSVNILITSILSLMWSMIATKMSFKGMKSNYPEDIVLSKGRGRIEVNTVIKGNKMAKMVPPDILNHFPKNGKLAKYFPKKENLGGLPKAESNREYEERVKKFLSGSGESAQQNEK